MTEGDGSKTNKTSFFKKIFSIFSKQPVEQSLEDSLAEFIEEESDKISKEEKELLHNVLKFTELKAKDIMIPRTDIIAVNYHITLEDLKKSFIEHEHTRLPIYQESLDNIIGFIHVKDLMPIISYDRPFLIDEILRQIVIVPPSVKVIDLLADMRHKRVHIAVVLDEYGGTDGLVTIEDLIEEIFGDINDEHDDQVEAEIIELPNGDIEVSARVQLEKIEKLLGIAITLEEDFDTIGGLILSLIGYIPAKGEKIIHHEGGIEFEVIDVDPRKIKRLIIRKIKVNEENY